MDAQMLSDEMVFLYLLAIPVLGGVAVYFIARAIGTGHEDHPKQRREPKF